MEFKSLQNGDALSTNDTLMSKSGELYKVIGFQVTESGAFDFNKVIIKPYPLKYDNSEKIIIDRSKLAEEGWSKKLFQRVG
ncbi:MAG TPA: hypothetical protein VIK89_03300 [Cytophagaceae bacterium]